MRASVERAVVSFRIEREWHKRLRDLAESSNTTISELMERVAIDYVKQNAPKVSDSLNREDKTRHVVRPEGWSRVVIEHHPGDYVRSSAVEAKNEAVGVLIAEALHSVGLDYRDLADAVVHLEDQIHSERQTETQAHTDFYMAADCIGLGLDLHLEAEREGHATQPADTKQ